MTQQVINHGAFVNDPTAETIHAAMAKVKTNFADLFGYNAWNALSPPSGTALVGDSDSTSAGGTDDGPALQALIDNSILSGGVSEILLPGRRTYKIGAKIVVPTGVRIRGVGERNGEDSSGPVRLIWGGAEDGIMFDVGGPYNNSFNSVFENVCLQGRSDAVNLPGTFIRYIGTEAQAGKPDCGCYLNNVWFALCRQDAVIFNAGATNFYIFGGRWDACGTQGRYGIYTPVASGLSLYMAGHPTFTCESGAGGFMYLNTEGSSGNGPAHVQIDALKIEVGGDLAETYAGGTNPYDKKGIFRLGVDQDNGAVTHHIHCDSLTVEMLTTWDSLSVFQITANEATDTTNSQYMNITVDGAIGLGQTTDATAVNGVIRPIGGRVPYARRPPEPLASANNWGRFQFGVGHAQDANKVANFCYAPYNYVDYTNSTILGPDVAFVNLPASPKTGQWATVTDAAGSLAVGTVMSTANDEGANTRPVFYDGTNWRLMLAT